MEQKSPHTWEHRDSNLSQVSVERLLKIKKGHFCTIRKETFCFCDNRELPFSKAFRMTRVRAKAVSGKVKRTLSCSATHRRTSNQPFQLPLPVGSYESASHLILHTVSKMTDPAVVPLAAWFYQQPYQQVVSPSAGCRTMIQENHLVKGDQIWVPLRGLWLDVKWRVIHHT